MVRLLGQAYWLAAPVVLAGVVHMWVVKRDWLRCLRVPLDGGRALGGKPIFGANKTWRGVVCMVGIAGIAGAVQGFAIARWPSLQPLSIVQLDADNPLAWAAAYAGVGGLLGLGYVLGELPNSFLKRRWGIAPGGGGRGALGAAFRLLDHLDSPAVGLALAALVLSLSCQLYLVGVVAFAVLHLAVVAMLVMLGIKRAHSG